MASSAAPHALDAAKVGHDLAVIRIPSEFLCDFIKVVDPAMVAVPVIALSGEFDCRPAVRVGFGGIRWLEEPGLGSSVAQGARIKRIATQLGEARYPEGPR